MGRVRVRGICQRILNFVEALTFGFVILPLKTSGTEKTKRRLVWFLRDTPMQSAFGFFLATGKK